MVHPRLYRLFLNRAHPFNLDLHIEDRRHIFERCLDRIVNTGSGDQVDQKHQNVDLSGNQQSDSHQHRGGKADFQERLRRGNAGSRYKL